MVISIIIVNIMTGSAGISGSHNFDDFDDDDEEKEDQDDYVQDIQIALQIYLVQLSKFALGQKAHLFSLVNNKGRQINQYNFKEIVSVNKTVSFKTLHGVFEK